MFRAESCDLGEGRILGPKKQIRTHPIALRNKSEYKIALLPVSK
jgi:hypothetical protein